MTSHPVPTLPHLHDRLLPPMLMHQQLRLESAFRSESSILVPLSLVEEAQAPVHRILHAPVTRPSAPSSSFSQRPLSHRTLLLHSVLETRLRAILEVVVSALEASIGHALVSGEGPDREVQMGWNPACSRRQRYGHVKSLLYAELAVLT